jgi:hypothetical protein
MSICVPRWFDQERSAQAKTKGIRDQQGALVRVWPSPGKSAYRHVGLAGLNDSVTTASDAATFRFGCGSVRRPPEPSTKRLPAGTPHVGQATTNDNFRNHP